MALYTPFFEKSTEKIGSAMMQKKSGNLAQAAYMGDQNAMAELMAVNPSLAMGIEQSQLQKQSFVQNQEDKRTRTQMAQQEAQQKAQRQAEQDAIAGEDRQRELYESNQELIEGVAKQAPNFDTIEEFQTFAKTQLGANPELVSMVDQLTPDQFEAFRTGYGKPEDDGLADQRERKIAQYQEMFGLSPEEAMQRVDTDVMMDDKGNVAKWNPITQSLSLITPEMVAQSPAPNVELNTQISDLKFDPGKGTGFAAAAIGLWNSTVGQVPFAPIGEETAQVAQNLRVLERDAIRALASSGRPPVIEQQRIAAIIPEAMAWSQNPQEAQLKMTNFVDLMAQQYIDDVRFASNPRNAEGLRDDSTRRAAEIESIVNRVLQPEAAQQMFSLINGSEKARTAIQELSDEDFDLIDPSTITDMQELDFYIERLESGLTE